MRPTMRHSPTSAPRTPRLPRLRPDPGPSARAGEVGGAGPGRAEQIGRSELEVEAATATRDEDGLPELDRFVDEGRVPVTLADGGDAAKDIASATLREGGIGHGGALA